MRKCIVYDGRHHVEVFFENGSRVDSESCADLESRKRLDGGNSKVHNLRFSHKVMDRMRCAKRRDKIVKV